MYDLTNLPDLFKVVESNIEILSFKIGIDV